jgi:hypothetical protein
MVELDIKAAPLIALQRKRRNRSVGRENIIGLSGLKGK